MTSQSSPDDEFLQVMRDTRSRYVAGFPDQIERLQRLAATATTDPAARTTLHSLAHRMAGLSGTVGFRTVGTCAAELEDALEAGYYDQNSLGDLIKSVRDAFNRDLAEPPSWAAPDSSAPQSAKILVVEDDDDLRALARGYLEASGYRTVTVARGDEALEAARREQPSLILLDVQLPGTDGYSVCRQLKADKATQSVPVMFVTTRGSLNERLAGLTLGADDYLTKPVDMRELLVRVRRLTSQRANSRDDAGLDTAALSRQTSSYEAWLDAARAALKTGPASVAMIRAGVKDADAAIALLQENLRRKDLVGVYDRSHLLVLFPDQSAAQSASRLTSAFTSAGGDALNLQAGVASGTTDIESLVAEADEALVVARHSGESVSTNTAKPAAAPQKTAATILVADDDPDVMRIIDSHLRGQGFATTIAFDGAAAVSGLDARPELVLLDLMMPKMTGFEVLQRLRQLEPPRPKVIVLSARGREEDVTRAFDLGADDYMVKPFSPQELGARIARLLR